MEEAVHNKYLAEGKFSEEEKSDLTQLYQQAKLDIKGACAAPLKADDSGMKPSPLTLKAVNDSTMKPATPLTGDQKAKVSIQGVDSAQ